MGMAGMIVIFVNVVVIIMAVIFILDNVSKLEARQLRLMKQTKASYLKNKDRIRLNLDEVLLKCNNDSLDRSIGWLRIRIENLENSPQNKAIRLNEQLESIKKQIEEL